MQGERIPTAQVLAAHDVGELAHELFVADRSEPDRIGPLREPAGRQLVAGLLGEP